MSEKRGYDVMVHPDALWSIRSIAKWSDYSYSTVANTFVNDPDFPKPVPQDGTRKPRWRAGDVMAFFGVDPQVSWPVRSPNHGSRAASS